ncbi:YbjN domain-containing protein [Allosphingosinicella flava]|uniref:YbjN domain-containing protein n=1 Tax=Allosphingosinicella flava TaxID=2771430 RepID=A0A7T2GKZ4_9SPHN|nr:YbjN domain-containing protein [Sphingosinicella flava]QPQ55789.1 YbjN domain-containing protein [Sphingosinicella flava]
MKTAPLILYVALALPSAASAAVPVWNPKAPENRQVLPAFTVANVGEILRAIGARHQSVGTAAAPRINVQFQNGRKATLLLSSCAGANCKAMSIQSSWTKISKAPPQQVSAAIEGFNHRYAFAKVYLSPSGNPSMQRYLTADYGFIRGDLAVNLLVFASQVDKFATSVLLPLEK